MKKLLLFTFLAFVMAVKTTAQVPREMQYSLMVISPVTGQVLTNKNVNLRLELRHGSDKGTTVWAQTYETKTDMTGYCQLTLSFPDTINWGQGSYYMALLVDGKEAGAPKLTTVPFSLCAASLEGLPRKEDLIGSWSSNDDYYAGSFTLLEDGYCLFKLYGNDKILNTNWSLSSNGILQIFPKPEDEFEFDASVRLYMPLFVKGNLYIIKLHDNIKYQKVK